MLIDTSLSSPRTANGARTADGYPQRFRRSRLPSYQLETRATQKCERINCAHATRPLNREDARYRRRTFWPRASSSPASLHRLENARHWIWCCPMRSASGVLARDATGDKTGRLCRKVQLIGTTSLSRNLPIQMMAPTASHRMRNRGQEPNRDD